MTPREGYSLIGSKLIRREGYHFVPTLAHWCPACESMHDFAVEAAFRNGARWSFNGDGERPTFSPSMNIGVGPFPDGRTERCHYHLIAGRLQFLGDCTHTMAGKTVDCPDVPRTVLLQNGLIQD